ncbi:MAG: hypothetical protein D6785_06710, partial [Planctomycetota bacterium]
MKLQKLFSSLLSSNQEKRDKGFQQLKEILSLPPFEIQEELYQALVDCHHPDLVPTLFHLLPYLEKQEKWNLVNLLAELGMPLLDHLPILLENPKTREIGGWLLFKLARDSSPQMIWEATQNWPLFLSSEATMYLYTLWLRMDLEDKLSSSIFKEILFSTEILLYQQKALEGFLHISKNPKKQKTKRPLLYTLLDQIQPEIEIAFLIKKSPAMKNKEVLYSILLDRIYKHLKEICKVWASFLGFPKRFQMKVVEQFLYWDRRIENIPYYYNYLLKRLFKEDIY